MQQQRARYNAANYAHQLRQAPNPTQSSSQSQSQPQQSRFAPPAPPPMGATAAPAIAQSGNAQRKTPQNGGGNVRRYAANAQQQRVGASLAGGHAPNYSQ